MIIGDRIKTDVWISCPDKYLNGGYEHGEILHIEQTKTVFNYILQQDETIEGKILIKFDDGRILPCYKAELIRL